MFYLINVIECSKNIFEDFTFVLLNSNVYDKMKKVDICLYFLILASVHNKNFRFDFEYYNMYFFFKPN